MANQIERYCNGCDRIYSWDDWQEDTCPFCDTPLSEQTEAPAGTEAFLDDTLSQEIPWPQGEHEVEVYRGFGYIDAQLIKAILEGSGIPVLLHSGAKFGLSVGDLGAVPIYVPESQAAEAQAVIRNQPSTPAARHTVTLYTKEGCHLCEKAKAALALLQGEFEVVLTEVDITTDPKLFEKYQYTIPVMVVDEQIELVSRIDTLKLRRALAEGYGPKLKP